MDTLELFNQARSAVATVQIMATARDRAAVDAQNRKDAAEDDFKVACAAADADLKAAQQAYQDAFDAAAPLQAEIAALMTSLMPTSDSRVRFSR